MSVHPDLIRSHGFELYESGPLMISSQISPCVLHKDHSPVTIINELHHIRPLYLQRRLWGAERNDERWSLCATGHSSVHSAIESALGGHGLPRWCVSKTRDLVEWTLRWYADESQAAAKLST